MTDATPRVGSLLTTGAARAAGSVVAIVIVAMAALANGCGSDSDEPETRTPPGTVTTEKEREAKKIYAGEVGFLPAPSRARRGPALVLPKDSLEVPGSFPLDSVVSFNVPVRNDGARALRILNLEPG